MAKTAPVALFVYNRLDHVQRTIQALKRNSLAPLTDLVIYSDGPKNETETRQVTSVRSYAARLDGFRSVRLIKRDQNLGLAGSLTVGIRETVAEHGRVIVLEDDIVTSPYFLTFMKEGLSAYEDDERVISIHGYVYPVRSPLPETFFLRGADCWGWATWERGWKLFDADASRLLAQIREQRLGHEFDFNGSYPYVKLLEDQAAGRVDSWAIRWYASAFIQGRYTLYPGRSLVMNIGTDASGTHCVATDQFDSLLSATPVRVVRRQVVRGSRAAFKAIEMFFRGDRYNRPQRALQRFYYLIERAAER